MAIPDIEVSEVGITGLFWLFLSYGYVLYYASNLISEGSDLLMLIPSMAGLVGGVVLPLLGAVPDGAIILFSGLGDLEAAQETLAVGVGALAGSTVMLLTVPFALSVYAGRVDLSESGQPNYLGKPKLSENLGIAAELSKTGVAFTEAIQHGGILMLCTTIPYFLIQGPAMFLHGPTDEVAAGEHWWSLAGLCICLAGLAVYMRLQLKISREGEDRDKRMAIVKKVLKKGKMSLSGAIASQMREEEKRLATMAASEYQSVDEGHMYPPPAVAEYLKEILGAAFKTYDDNGDGELDRHETKVFFRDFHEAISEEEMDELFAKYDIDKSGFISIDEFIGLAYSLIKAQEKRQTGRGVTKTATRAGINSYAIADEAFATVEEEEVPEEFTDLPPDQQQAAIKMRAFIMLAIGAVLVVVFSDPMVDVMQEIAVRANLSPFYVSFVLAPLASNASEVIASMYYASKKTRKTMTVSISALEGAACMNNTFCLSIFMGLIFFRGLAWQYTAETLSILVVEVILAIMVQAKVMTLGRGLFILTLFPLSLVLVATLEAFGFD